MILFINACVRTESRTKRLADALLSHLSGEVQEVDLAKVDFPVADEAFLLKRTELLTKEKWDDPMFDHARQFREADTVVVAAPYWDLSFPAALKQYFEQINCMGITFTYTPEGTPLPLCKAKKLYYVMTAGGALLPMEFGYGYVKALAENFYGILETHLIKAVGFDIEGADIEKILQDAIREMEEELFAEKNTGSRIRLIQGSCAAQEADVIVNAANRDLREGMGICGVIFGKAGSHKLQTACNKIPTPLQDGDAVITPSFNLKNAKAIIHAVGPDFRRNRNAFDKLFLAYYNSLVVMKANGYHSISFPLISAGIFGGSLENPSAVSAEKCCEAYLKFTEDFPDYQVDVMLCAYTAREHEAALLEFFRYNLPNCLDRFNPGGDGVVPVRN